MIISWIREIRGKREENRGREEEGWRTRDKGKGESCKKWRKYESIE